MKETEYTRRQAIVYLLFTFVVAYAIQIGVCHLYKSGSPAYQILMAAMMFVPFFGVLVSGHPLKGMGWKPVFKGNMKIILFAWLAPAVLSALGALIYFLVFPQHFDLSGSYVVSTVGESALQQMKESGITYPTYVLITCVGCITYFPLINMFFGMGEEVGWRGFLYPQLKARFGRRTGRLLGGAIWGTWHWPVIWLIGYDYGTEYFGFPVVGMLLFALVTVALGIIADWTYEKTGCIWLPSLFHGAFNAAATVAIAVCIPEIGSARLLGPSPVGLLAGIPFFVIALILFFSKKGKIDSAQNGKKSLGFAP